MRFEYVERVADSKTLLGFVELLTDEGYTEEQTLACIQISVKEFIAYHEPLDRYFLVKTIIDNFDVIVALSSGVPSSVFPRYFRWNIPKGYTVLERRIQ